MLRQLWFLFSLSLLSLLLMVGCGGSNGGTVTRQNPVPLLTTISPESASAGSADLMLTATGSGFVSGATVNWDGSALKTVYVSDSQLTATVPSADTTAAGTHAVTVFNPAPGGGSSGQLTFTVSTPQNPLPVATSLSPSTVVVGSGAFTLTVNGSGFISSSQILWNGSAVTTTYGSSTALTAQIPALDVAAVGTATVAVMTPAPGGGTSSNLTFMVKAADTNLNELNLYGSDIVWDAKAQKLYVAAQDSKGSSTGSITVVDPIAGTVVSTKTLNYVPTGLALSDDSQFLYAVIDNGTTIQRFLLPAITEDIQWQLGTDPTLGGQMVAGDIQVQPGAAHTLAVAMGKYASGYVAIFDDGVERTDVAQDVYGIGNTLAWSVDGKTLYATYGQSTDTPAYSMTGTNNEIVFAMPVTASGAGKSTDLQQAFRGVSQHLHLDPATGNLYDDLGEVIQAAQAIPVGNYRFDEGVDQGTNYGPFTTVDDGLQMAFKLRQVPLPNKKNGIEIKVFDAKTYRLLRTTVVSGAAGNPMKFIRWGNSGLAFLTQGESSSSGGGLFLLDGGFLSAGSAQDSTAGNALSAVPTLTGLTPLTATVGSSGLTLTVTGVDMLPTAAVYWNGIALPTTYVSATQVTAQVPASDLTTVAQAAIEVTNSSDGLELSNQIPFSVNSAMTAGNQLAIYDAGGWDVVWDAGRSKFYVGLPGAADDGQNGIATIDPAAGTVVRSAFVGSDPGRLSIASDGNSLYTGLNGANGVTQLSLPDMTAGSQWNLGGAGTFDGPYHALDIEAAPATAEMVAFGLGMWDQSPFESGLLVYSGSTLLTNSIPDVVKRIGAVQWGGDDTTLYATDGYDDFAVLGVNASTVTADHYYENRVTAPYTIHYDTGTKLIYTDSGQIIDPSTGKVTATLGASGLAAVDSTLNRVFILGQTTAQYNTNSYTIESFDQTKLTAVDSITIDNVQGPPTALIRWGTNGLAFTTLPQYSNGPYITGPGQFYVVSGTFVKPSDSSAKPAQAKVLPPVHRTWGTIAKSAGKNGAGMVSRSQN